jgi:hypothetical protein
MCPTGQDFCAGACVDTKTTPAHCGGCNMACAADQLCQGGQCACSPGQMNCSGSCVDLQTSSKACGACGNACAPDEVCMAGKCHAPLGEDGCSGSARDLSIKEIAAYQSIKIPLSKGVDVIATKDRLASVVQGRPTLFRVFVDVPSSFSARQLSARLSVKNAGKEDKYFAKQMVSKASTDADTASTFQISVPADKIQDATSYSIELVECSAGVMGTMQKPRFPAMGDSPLEARKTGILKVKVIPLVANNHSGDTTDTALAVYKAFMEAMYPIEHIELSVGNKLNVSYPVNWNTTLDQLRSQRQADKPPADVYYYGLLKPTDTFDQYCKSGCTAGVGYVGSATQSATHVAMGLAYGDELAAGIMAHEVGHNHGRNHAPCAPGNNISGVDSKYPYMGALVGVWGYDTRKMTFFAPDKAKDIMGYCDPKWISDYTYKGLTDRVAQMNGNMFEFTDPASLHSYRVLLIDEDGPRWGQPIVEPSAAFGDEEPADVLDVNGEFLERITVYRTSISDALGSTILVPEPKSGWNAVRVLGGESLAFSAPVTVPAPQASK